MPNFVFTVKKLVMLLRKGKRLFFAFVLTAIVISGQVLPNRASSIPALDKDVLSETSGTDEHDESAHTTTLSAAYAVIPILKLHVAACFHIVQELILLCEIEQKSECPIPLYIDDFFRTLFRHIIAPNAP